MPPYKSRGSAFWSLILLVQESQGVLLLGGSSLIPDGGYGTALSPHVPFQSLPMRETLGVTTSTDEHEVKVLPHVAEGSLRVLIENSTVGAEGQLPVLSPNAN